MHSLGCSAVSIILEKGEISNFPIFETFSKQIQNENFQWDFFAEHVSVQNIIVKNAMKKCVKILILSKNGMKKCVKNATNYVLKFLSVKKYLKFKFFQL